MFLHLTEREREKKKYLFCAVFCSLQSRSVGLQKQSVSLSSAFYSFYTVCTGAHLISQPRHTQAHYLDLHKTESEASHMGNDVFPSFGNKTKKKTEKKKYIRSTSVKLFCFSSFILTNDITVQLLASVVAETEGEGVFEPRLLRSSAPPRPPL